MTTSSFPPGIALEFKVPNNTAASIALSDTHIWRWDRLTVTRSARVQADHDLCPQSTCKWSDIYLHGQKSTNPQLSTSIIHKGKLPLCNKIHTLVAIKLMDSNCSSNKLLWLVQTNNFCWKWDSPPNIHWFESYSLWYSENLGDILLWVPLFVWECKWASLRLRFFQHLQNVISFFCSTIK